MFSLTITRVFVKPQLIRRNFSNKTDVLDLIKNAGKYAQNKINNVNKFLLDPTTSPSASKHSHGEHATQIEQDLIQSHRHSHIDDNEHGHSHDHGHSHSHKTGEPQEMEDDMVDMWNENAPAGREWNGPRGMEPTRYSSKNESEWEKKGRVTDF
jgi:hypothetical protein